MSTQQRQGRLITAIATNPNGSKVTASITGKPTINNLVLVGQKIISKEKDDPYVETCGKACAKKLGVEATKVSTGTEFILALEKASINEELSACVYWGHSWNVGLYLQNENGFYVDSYPYGSGSGQRR